ncbi:hypothetical protein [Citrobacter farmeri]|uniref:hypothetical protein n=1 Tax=Citrobacter farmeri TaxID=67824 RepID=UPI0019026080|nr:hypothetical protein [Citrobacter farmeri]MBJ9135938.1 hypothetical protein [Citrobacter farmeri]
MDDNAGNTPPRKRPRTTCIFWLLCALMLLSLIVAANSLVVFTWFHRIPPVLLVLCSLVILPVGSGIFWRILTLVPACFIAILLYWLLLFFAPREFQREFASPSGEKHLVIEYDHASRPSLYSRHSIFMIPIATPDLVGSTEIIVWRVEWLSDDEIRLYPPDEAVSVDISLR